MSSALVVVIVVQIFFLVFTVAAFIHALFSLIGGFSVGPYVATDRRTIKRMLDLAGVKQGMRIVELGSGNGELCLQAARRGCIATGIEFNPVLVLVSRFRSRLTVHRSPLTAHRSPTYYCADVWRTCLPTDTDAVFCYSIPMTMDRIWRKFQKEAKPGAVLVSHAFEVPGVVPDRTDGNVRLYRVNTA